MGNLVFCYPISISRGYQGLRLIGGSVGLRVLHKHSTTQLSLFFYTEQGGCKGIILSEDVTLVALDDFEKIWGIKYPYILQSWRRNWGKIATFCKGHNFS